MNTYLDLPVPAANGVGASVDVTNLGRQKTISIDGAFGGANVHIEASNDGGLTFATVATFVMPGTQPISAVVQFMRCRVANAPGGVSANCDVGGPTIDSAFVNLPDAGLGPGASADCSALGEPRTIVVTGAFSGQVAIEASEDNVDFVQVMAFTAPGVRSRNLTAQFMRINRNSAIGTAQVDVGGERPPGEQQESSPNQTFVLRPGGTAGGNVYTTWASLVTALTAAGPGPKIIAMDTTLGAISIPAGTYDMRNVTWLAARPDNTLALVTLQAGAQFTKLTRFEGPLQLQAFAAAGTPHVVLEDGDQVVFKSATQFQCDTFGTGTVFDGSALAGGESAGIVLDGPGVILIGAGLFAHFGAGAGTLRLMRGCSIQNNTLGGSGSILIDRPDGSASYNFTQASFSGTYTATNGEQTSMDVSPAPGQAVHIVSFNASLGLNRYNTDGLGANALVVTLPLADGGSPSTGVQKKMVFLSDYASIDGGATSGITVGPSGADTINGLASLAVNQERSIFVSDGTSDWRLLETN